MKKMNEFAGLYPLSKTLRFELIPQGKTIENIEKQGYLIKDENRAENYKEVKKIIDEYHKDFIEKALKDFKLRYDNLGNNDSLEEYIFLYQVRQKDESQRKKFIEVQARLRKQIADRFEKDNTFKEKFKRLFAKELIKEDLLTFVKNERDIELVSEFKNFTTYFTGFHENRKNMYSDEEKATAIAYRLIHENLPRFIDNIVSFEKVKDTVVADNFKKLYEDLEEYLNVLFLEDIFTLASYSDFITQTQIDVYNTVIGGKTTDDGKKIQGLNEYINLYNQKQTDKTKRLPKLKPLYKQILSDRNAISWLPENFRTDNEVLESIAKCYNEIKECVFYKKKDGEHSLIELLQHLKDFDLNRIYLRNDTSITEISQKMFGNWAVIQRAVEAKYEIENTQKARESNEKFEERKAKYFKAFDSLSIGFINDCLALLGGDYTNKVEDYFESLGKDDDEKKNAKDLFAQVEDNYNAVESLLNTEYPKERDLAQDKVAVEKIKMLLDSLKAVQWFVKPLLGKGNEADKDEKFYGEFTGLSKILDQINPLYNMVRNYMTRKPYSIEKIKLNFENSTLLDGWDVNKEPDNTSVILRKDGLYYLAIMDKRHNKLFRKEFNDTFMPCFEKIEYKFFKDLTTMIPKCSTQLKEVKQHFSVSNYDYVLDNDNFIKPLCLTKEIFELNNFTIDGKKKFQIDYLRQSGDELGYKNALFLWIEFCISFLKSYRSTDCYDYSSIKPASAYERIDEFYDEVNKLLYNLSFRNIPESYINDCVNEGKLYLFQIYNKDFSPYSKGTPNMHTLYWKMLFHPENLKDVVYKLNGQAEVFYRKSSIKNENKIIHPANRPIDNRNQLNDKKQSIFKYDIIKDKRYTVDKFQFHVPITMNFKADGINNINPMVNQYLKENIGDLHIIGIDRGERHLLYLTLVNLRGEIVKQFSLNEIINEYKGNSYKTNYHDLLGKREKARLVERESWKTIETIKELKEGYISQVIHKIADLMVKYNAIVVLEDLNMGFMRGRQKVEKSVYQKFEKMLIDKLNYLVDKNQPTTEPGGTLKAFQLTNKFESFKTMGKQSGFLFYVPAWNTSKMDPVTGFVNLFDTKYENMEKTKSFFSKFDSILFNQGKNYFEFTFDYNNFTTKADGTKTKWTVCTNNKRIETFRNPEKNNQWDNREINLTIEFTKLFDQYNIGYSTDDLKSAMEKQTEKAFFERLLHLFKLTLQMRNSITGTETDYLISPVANEKGEFYYSENEKLKGKDEKGNWISNLPVDADANGAYNIARKGLWVIEQIKQADDLKKLKLAISNKEWLSFAQTLQ